MQAFRRLLWLVPILVTVHNLEELPTIAPFAARLGLRVTTAQFLVGQLIVTAILIAITYFGARGQPDGIGALGMVAALIALLVNSLSHVGQALWFRSYAPGVLTAAFLQIPAYSYLVIRAVREGYIARARLGLAAVLSILAIPIVLISLYIGSLIS